MKSKQVLGTRYYYITDHQGNVRAVVDGTGALAEVNGYYPFGGLMAGGATHGVQPYKYGGKELDRESGLDWYDSRARWLDPAVGRTTTMDPKAESYYSISPYAWCANTPMRFVDKNGKFPTKSLAELSRNMQCRRDNYEIGLVMENPDSKDLQFRYIYSKKEFVKGELIVTCYYKFDKTAAESVQDFGNAVSVVGYALTLSCVGAEIGVPIAKTGDVISEFGSDWGIALDCLNIDTKEALADVAFKTIDYLTKGLLKKTMPGYGKKFTDEAFNLGTEILDQSRRLKISLMEWLANLIKNKRNDENKEDSDKSNDEKK